MHSRHRTARQVHTENYFFPTKTAHTQDWKRRRLECDEQLRERRRTFGDFRYATPNHKKPKIERILNKIFDAARMKINPLFSFDADRKTQSPGKRRLFKLGRVLVSDTPHVPSDWGFSEANDDFYFSHDLSRNTYFRDVTINYNINRQRGSTSRYINEAKESCIGSSLEHNGIAEMVVHLNRYDKIFVSVSQSDIQFLSTHVGAHMIGLFEL